MVVRPITRAALPRLAPLLRASFGAGFDIADEIEFFPDSAPPGWLYLTDTSGLPYGFLRHFAVTEALNKAEIYVQPSAQRPQYLEQLLKAFGDASRLSTGITLRFDIGVSDTELRRAVAAACTVVQAKTFLYFERALPGVAEVAPSGLSFAPRGPATLTSARRVLGRLKPYTLETLAELLANRRLCLLEKESEVLAALHVEPVGGAVCEVVALATTPALEGCGYGYALLSSALSDNARRFDRVRLRVDAGNSAAVRLYRKAEFVEKSEKAEVWLYTKWS